MSIRKIVMLLAVVLVGLLYASCWEERQTADTKQRDRQEQLQAEAVAQVGMPAIKNWREMKILKDIYELRDQDGLVTYTYAENLSPIVVRGYTALGGKLTYIGQSIGYGIPASTQYSSPEKLVRYSSYGPVILPQCEPNGLFSPSSAEGTWILLQNPSKIGDVLPIYVEPRVIVLPFKLPVD